jgi:hypothetical protein
VNNETQKNSEIAAQGELLPIIKSLEKDFYI